MDGPSVCHGTDDTASDQATYHPLTNIYIVIRYVGSNCESTSDDESYENPPKTKTQKHGSGSVK